ncbi:MAG: radical SAM protein with 4Fe4S-binding SPASM domain [Pseudohongiellaceae bacterium]|jgi:radical SAM protein with 4Fe4S-binding SPASM domain
MRAILARWLARAYLGKPDLGEFVAMRVPDLPSFVATVRNELAFRLGLHGLPLLTTLNVELTSRCNVACSYCDVNRELGRPAQDLPLEILARLLEQTPSLQTLLPFQWGEPLLYEALDEALALATSHGLRSYLTTNGTLLDGDRMVSLGQTGLTRLTISLDGGPEAHQDRRGYSQDNILRRLAEARRARDTEGLATRLDVSMVVDETVAGEMAEFRQQMEPLCDRVQFIPKMIDGERSSPCREPSRGLLVVLSDGRITTCCADVRGELNLGHVDDGTPAQIYAAAPWRQLRAAHQQRQWPEICARCEECAVPGVSKRFS